MCLDTGFIKTKDDGCVAKVVCEASTSCPGDHTACTVVDNKIACGCQNGYVNNNVILNYLKYFLETLKLSGTFCSFL